jgi:predicted transcriptional regulator
MTSKEMAIKTIQQMPDSATWGQIKEPIRFLAALDEGLEDIKAGRLVPHEDVKESLRQWLSK